MIGQIIDKNLGIIELDRKTAWNGEGFIILCVIPKKREFVTWFINEEDMLFSGHYYYSLRAALEDFDRRS